MPPPLRHQTQQGGPHGYPTGQSSRPRHRSVGPTGENCFVVIQLLLLMIIMGLLLINLSLDASHLQ
jgi:hypothetical protein